MVIEVGLVTAIQDWVGEPASQQPAGQGLVTQVRTLELGGETEEELPEIDVGEWSPDGDTFLCGTDLVRFDGDRRSLGANELSLRPAAAAGLQQVGAIGDLVDLAGVEPVGDPLGGVQAAPVEIPVRQPAGDEGVQQVPDEPPPRNAAAAR